MHLSFEDARLLVNTVLSGGNSLGQAVVRVKSKSAAFEPFSEFPAAVIFGLAFIVDFACTKYRLTVEADGGQHSDNQGGRPTDSRPATGRVATGSVLEQRISDTVAPNYEAIVARLLEAPRR